MDGWMDEWIEAESGGGLRVLTTQEQEQEQEQNMESRQEQGSAQQWQP